MPENAQPRRRHKDDDFTPVTLEEMLQFFEDRASESSPRLGYSVQWLNTLYRDMLWDGETEGREAVDTAALHLYHNILTLLEQPELSDHADKVSLLVELPTITLNGEDITPWPTGSDMDVFQWVQSEIPLRDNTPLSEADLHNFTKRSNTEIHEELERLVAEDEERENELYMGWQLISGELLRAGNLFLHLMNAVVKEIPADATFTAGSLIISLYDDANIETVELEDGRHIHIPFKAYGWNLAPFNLIPDSTVKNPYGELLDIQPGFHIFDEFGKYAASCECGECIPPLTLEREKQLGDTSDRIFAALLEATDEGVQYHFTCTAERVKKDEPPMTGYLVWERKGEKVSTYVDGEEAALGVTAHPIGILSGVFHGEFARGSATLMRVEKNDGFFSKSGLLKRSLEPRQVMGWVAEEGKIVPLRPDDLTLAAIEADNAGMDMNVEGRLVFVEAFDLGSELR